MKKNLLHLSAVALLTCLPLSPASGQGALMPPSPPGPTMKTLDQIEARTDVLTLAGDENATHVINQAGSYYLSGSLDVVTRDGIRIEASNVTLDLNGYTIYRSSNDEPTGTAILLSLDTFGSGQMQNVVIRNGHIYSRVTYDPGASGDQFTGAGFNYGIHLTATDPTSTAGARNVRVSDMRVVGCGLGGIALDFKLGTAVETTRVTDCLVSTVGGIGIAANFVDRCAAYDCGDIAIGAGFVEGSRGVSVKGYAIFATQVDRSYGLSQQNTGIWTNGPVSNSFGISNSETVSHVGIQASNVINSWATGKRGAIQADVVQNSTGLGSQGHGIEAKRVDNSYATSFTVSAIQADSVVSSYGRSTEGAGIAAKTVQSSTGVSTKGVGIAAKAVQSSTGVSSLNHGIEARLVSHSYGESQAGDDPTAPLLASGIRSDGTVSYSYGDTTSTNGGVGIFAEIGIGCTSGGGQFFFDQYLMP